MKQEFLKASGKTPLDYAESAAMINFLKSHGATELNR
jgi:hypothetical protein